jgi:Flp pilus assembly protein TadD
MSRLLALILLAALTACASGGKPSSSGNKAMNNAASSAIDSGNVGQSVALAEKAYKASPKNPDAALNYATALRMAGRETQAKIVLQEFADSPKASAGVLNESVRIALSEGQYKRALATAKNSTQLNPDNADSWHVLGLAYDAVDQLKEAEAAYRKSLEEGPKNKASVLNNLALNLTLQEKLDQALPIMEEALALDPGRREFKRNRAMIRAMHTQIYHTVE